MIRPLTICARPMSSSTPIPSKDISAVFLFSLGELIIAHKVCQNWELGKIKFVGTNAVIG